jgi:predicted acyltransferase
LLIHNSGAAQSVAPRSRQRYLSLDVFRGFTVAGMLLVNTPGSWGSIYAPLRHAAWHGWTFADLIFPFFLFVVGVTTHISVAAAREGGVGESAIFARILKRGALITLVGLLVSAFPYFPLERITEMRIPGVLQRIGVTYTIAAVITMRGSWRSHLVWVAAILLGYWYLMTGVPVPGQPPDAPRLDSAATTLAAWVDRLLLDGHLWSATKSWDPEGVLSTFPAITSVMLGTLAGRLTFATTQPDDQLRYRVIRLAAFGLLGIALGLAWDMQFPINKGIWTSSYVVFTAGIAAVCIATCVWMVDLKKWRWFTGPFATFGLNPLVAFVGSMLMARCIYSLIKVPMDGTTVPLQAAIYGTVFEPWLSPLNASLAFAVSFVCLWFVILKLLERRKIVIKV